MKYTVAQLYKLLEEYAKKKYPSDKLAQGWTVFDTKAFLDYLKVKEK